MVAVRRHCSSRHHILYTMLYKPHMEDGRLERGSRLGLWRYRLGGLNATCHPLCNPSSSVTRDVSPQSLSLTSAGFPGVAPCPHLGLMVIAFMILFSQFLR